jgi:hypothetical protein
VTVQLTVKKIPTKPLFLDFRAVSIANLAVNGTLVNDVTVFRDHKVFLPTNLLKNGENKVFFLHHKING